MWEHILNFVSLLAVLTNALIMAFHSTWMRNRFAKIYGDNENQLLVARLLFILMFEVSYTTTIIIHIFIFIKRLFLK